MEQLVARYGRVGAIRHDDVASPGSGGVPEQLYPSGGSLLLVDVGLGCDQIPVLQGGLVLCSREARNWCASSSRLGREEAW